MSIQSFCAWLSTTPLSLVIQTYSWIVPTVQSVHILAIAVVLSCVLVIDLRLARLVSRTEPLDAVMRRYIPWLWIALSVLLASGTVLVIGEPARELLNWVFYLKMGLLLCVVVITLVFERPLLKDGEFWDLPSRGRAAKALAWLSLAVWVAIVFCGRWIAYAYSPSA
jgi:uncharacterized membrane protein